MTTQKHLTIMIVEDNSADVYLLKKALETARMDFKAVVFEEGETAFKYVDGEAGFNAEPPPDVAILDLNIPKHNGAEVLAHIRGKPKLRLIPIVILSSSPKQVMRDQAAQADCYITKPTELQAFIGIGQEIRNCIESVRAARILPVENH
jgi:chemotaxis family two-component system response regulator Rcp1